MHSNCFIHTSFLPSFLPGCFRSCLPVFPLSFLLSGTPTLLPSIPPSLSSCMPTCLPSFLLCLSACLSSLVASLLPAKGRMHYARSIPQPGGREDVTCQVSLLSPVQHGQSARARGGSRRHSSWGH